MDDREMDQVDQSGSMTSPSSETSEFATQTIDITSWFNTDLSSSGSFNLGIMAATSFGKLLDVLAVPALLIDWQYTVVFANRSCGRLAENFKSVVGVPFSSLVPRSANAEKAQTLIRRVFRTRRSQVADGILELDAKKIWGRLYFRPVRIGPDRYVLLLIEDLTNEKTQLLLSQRQLQQTFKSLEDLDKLASHTDQRLRQEVSEHSKTKEALWLEMQRFEALSELIPGCSAIITSDGKIKNANPRFRELFGLNGVGDQPRELQEVQEWLRALEDSQASNLGPALFQIEVPGGTRKQLRCTASRIKPGEFLLFCEDVEDTPKK